VQVSTSNPEGRSRSARSCYSIQVCSKASTAHKDCMERSCPCKSHNSEDCKERRCPSKSHNDNEWSAGVQTRVKIEEEKQASLLS